MADSSSSDALPGDLRAADDDAARHADPQEARKKAMDYLARREYGRAELCARLAGAGFEPAAAATAVARLADEGLQDERRFAEAFVRARIGRGKGPLRMRAELAQRGIAEALIDTVLDEAGEDWAALACRIREKKFGRSRPRAFPEKARQMRFLQYRGFGPEAIRAAVDGAD